MQELEQVSRNTVPICWTPKGDQWNESLHATTDQNWFSDHVVTLTQDSSPKQTKKKRDLGYDSNKIVVRSIRRFFMKMFKAENPKLVNGRFRTFKGCLFVAAIKKMIQLHGIANGKEGNADDLAVFVFRLLGIKSKDKKKYSNDIESKGEQVQDCMYKYSHHKFKRVWATAKLIKRHLRSIFVTTELVELLINCYYNN